jgi:hypothetical protein
VTVARPLVAVAVIALVASSACTEETDAICRSNTDCSSNRCENERCVIPDVECCTCLVALSCINAAATQESCLDDIRNDETSDFVCIVPTSGCGHVCGFLLPGDGEPCVQGNACDATSLCVDPDTFEGPEPAVCRALCESVDDPCRAGTCQTVEGNALACLP